MPHSLSISSTANGVIIQNKGVEIYAPLSPIDARHIGQSLIDAAEHLAAQQDRSEIAKLKRDLQQLATSLAGIADKLARLESLANTHAVFVEWPEQAADQDRSPMAAALDELRKHAVHPAGEVFRRAGPPSPRIAAYIDTRGFAEHHG
jgi:hypothetical protein